MTFLVTSRPRSFKSTPVNTQQTGQKIVPYVLSMENQLKRKVTVKFDYNKGNVYSRASPPSRPASPSKLPQPSPLSPPLGFRPKAKINSSATVRNVASTNSLKPTNGSAQSISRPTSPFKPARSSPSEPVQQVKARMTARPMPKPATVQVHSTPTAPEYRQRSSTTVSSNLHPKVSEDRRRSGSMALHHALSTEQNGPHIGSLKVRAKVSGLAKSNSDNASLPLSPSWATTRPIHTRNRAPSITSSFSMNPSSTASSSEMPFYPITTAAPAANPHRFDPARRAPSPHHYGYHSFAGSEALSASYTKFVPKSDPTKIPLPPQSPPISALSLSSRSSASRSSVFPSIPADKATSSQVTLSMTGSHINPLEGVYPTIDRSKENISPTNAALLSEHITKDASHAYEIESDGGDSQGSERKARATAKSNRKIADLEITNRSLLAINASLETTKLRQAKEIRDLRRKLRESRLILPPTAYKAVTSQDNIPDQDDSDHDGDDDSENGEEWGADETYRRIQAMVDGLIDTGKRALEKKPQDFQDTSSARVLNADELRSWRDSGYAGPSAVDIPLHGAVEGDDDSISRHSLSPARLPNDDIRFSSEDEVDRLTLDPDSPIPTHLPPITITPSI
ncbi:hypothetical protein BJ138DRAFT_107482 [Hygrophoropsis aurantiaca]|uniref:Uncharacterized protein n=1 Tax=Hygrophoropsis aurantiaca TaxID=72124 RepID=A0ACB8AB35_9AGAM|nr:hypothetical protein BJ138DRAFT_107482 [Hygrophoropsis aurantiaca]